MAKKAIPLSELPVVDKTTPAHFNPEGFQKGAVILMDKPVDWSSFHLVKYVRNRIPPKKVGHAGTLDPLATGLLILCSGRATKSISQIQDLSKTYIADITFGASTPSYDTDTEPDQTADWDHISRESIEACLAENFTGTIQQKPPVYSAIRVQGERLYKRARRGEDVEINPRPVQIYSSEILKCSMPVCRLKVTCGKGTYIRSLANDLGLALSSRAHLSALRRTETGQFSVENAFNPEQFQKFIDLISHG